MKNFILLAAFMAASMAWAQGQKAQPWMKDVVLIPGANSLQTYDQKNSDACYAYTAATCLNSESCSGSSKNPSYHPVWLAYANWSEYLRLSKTYPGHIEARTSTAGGSTNEVVNGLLAIGTCEPAYMDSQLKKAGYSDSAVFLGDLRSFLDKNRVTTTFVSNYLKKGGAGGPFEKVLREHSTNEEAARKFPKNLKLIMDSLFDQCTISKAKLHAVEIHGRALYDRLANKSAPTAAHIQALTQAIRSGKPVSISYCHKRAIHPEGPDCSSNALHLATGVGLGKMRLADGKWIDGFIMKQSAPGHGIDAHYCSAAGCMSSFDALVQASHNWTVIDKAGLKKGCR